jgi:hypothetical protein
VVRLGHRRAVFLAHDIEAALAHRENGRACLQRQFGGKRNQCIIVHSSVIPAARDDGNARRHWHWVG